MPIETMPVMKGIPQHEHDCEECIFLASDEEYDYYYCEKGGIKTVIARYGEHSKYFSGLDDQIVSGYEPLKIAKAIAKVKRLLKDGD